MKKMPRDSSRFALATDPELRYFHVQGPAQDRSMPLAIMGRSLPIAARKEYGYGFVFFHRKELSCQLVIAGDDAGTV